jgi:hypothetical protein
MTPSTSAFGSRVTRGLAVILFGALIAACSPAASVAPSASAVPVATAAPSVAPSVAPTAAPTPSASTATASGSAQPDPAIGLKIAAPYALTVLDPALEALFRDQFTQGAGSFGSLIGLGGRTVTQDGKLAGYVFVIGFPTGMLSATAYQAMLTGMEPGMGVAFTTEKISGVDVSTGSSPSANVAVFKDGDHVILALTPTIAELPAVAKALIDANK